MNGRGRHAGRHRRRLALPADAPVLELGSWPPQGDSLAIKPVPVDAARGHLQTLGTGRIVWFQKCPWAN